MQDTQNLMVHQDHIRILDHYLQDGNVGEVDTGQIT